MLRTFTFTFTFALLAILARRPRIVGASIGCSRNARHGAVLVLLVMLVLGLLLPWPRRRIRATRAHSSSEQRRDPLATRSREHKHRAKATRQHHDHDALPCRSFATKKTHAAPTKRLIEKRKYAGRGAVSEGAGSCPGSCRSRSEVTYAHRFVIMPRAMRAISSGQKGPKTSATSIHVSTERYSSSSCTVVGPPSCDFSSVTTTQSSHRRSRAVDTTSSSIAGCPKAAKRAFLTSSGSQTPRMLRPQRPWSMMSSGECPEHTSLLVISETGDVTIIQTSTKPVAHANCSIEVVAAVARRPDCAPLLHTPIIENDQRDDRDEDGARNARDQNHRR